MQGLLIALVCLTCASCRRRLQTPVRAGDLDISNPSKAFASMLEVLKPAAAFNLPLASAPGRVPTANAFSNRARSPDIQALGVWNWANTDVPPETVASVAAKIAALAAAEQRNASALQTLSQRVVEANRAAATEMKETERERAPAGPFAPAVLAAKRVMGEKELLEFRAEVIRQHTKVISDFVDTSDSKFGQVVLEQMFKAADKDNNGTLDSQEIQDALSKLGFTFMKDKEVVRLIKKADSDKNEVIDLEEFKKETPKMLRVNLVKLAKANGHDLGFLA